MAKLTFGHHFQLQQQQQKTQFDPVTGFWEDSVYAYLTPLHHKNFPTLQK